MKELPVGIDSFVKLIRGEKNGNPYYYIDKTLLIRELASTGGEVNLIPRPRRFGKSLNLDMIRQFMSIDADKSIFDGLKISEDTDFCAKYQGQYPVLFLNYHALPHAGSRRGFCVIMGSAQTRQNSHPDSLWSGVSL